MKTIKDIKNYIDSKEGNSQNYYQITSDSKIQVYKTRPIQAAIFWDNQAILKIEERNENKLSFFLPSENNEYEICYSKECSLSDGESIVKIYSAFENHKSIEKVLACLLFLNFNLD